MRTSTSFVIVRFWTQKKAIFSIVLLIIIGYSLDEIGLTDKPAHVDRVCWGSQEYDVGDDDSREKLLDDLARHQPATLNMLQQPPCDGSGSPLLQNTIDKIFKKKPVIRW